MDYRLRQRAAQARNLQYIAQLKYWNGFIIRLNKLQPKDSITRLQGASGFKFEIYNLVNYSMLFRYLLVLCYEMHHEMTCFADVMKATITRN